MNKENLKNSWEEYKKKNFPHTVLSDYPYYKKEAQQISLGLTFWKFIRSHVDTCDDQSKKEFLLEYTTNKNNHVALIAMVEMLPEVIWRKCLWRYNIDFMSLESFLRRITPNQRQAIEDNWNDLYQYDQNTQEFEELDQIPTVMNERLIDRIVILFYSMCAFFGGPKFFSEKRKALSLEDSKRYLSKAAWDENLAYLDFGFGLYSDGLQSDKKMKDISIFRFFSVKNHVNDFVVNQEDGVYWFFYRFTRSYGGIKKWNEITLQPWICPGFWMTIGFMVWFLVGPFFGLPLLTSGISKSEWFFEFGVVLAGPFIIWSVVWILYLLITGIKTLIKNFNISVKKIAIPIMLIVMVCIATFLFVCIGEIFWGMHKMHISLFEKIGLFDPKIGAIVMDGALLYTMGVIVNNSLYERDIIDFKVGKKWSQNTFLTYLALWTIVATLFWRVEIWNAIVMTRLYIWSNLAVILLLLAFAVSISYVIVGALASDKKFLSIKRRLTFMIVVHVTSYIGLVIIDSNDGIMLNMIYGITMITFVVTLIQRMRLLNQDSLVKIKYVKEVMSSPLHGYEMKKHLQAFQKLIALNKGLNADNVNRVCDDIFEISKWIGLDERPTLWRIALQTGTPHRISRLKKLYLGCGNREGVKEKFSNRFERLNFFRYIIEGSSLKEAIELALQSANEQKQKKEQKKERLNSVKTKLLWFASPLIKLGKLIKKVCNNLYRLWRTMYKDACPYSPEQTYLQ